MENIEKHKKPIDYSKSKIYKIVCDTTKLTYIGSTIEALSRRLSGHRAAYKRYLKGNNRYVLKNNNYKIILIENCPCKNKEELERQERKYIETIECVNKNIPGRTYKEYYEDNKDKIKETQKEWYETNKNKIKEQQKKWYENNKDKISEKYEDNKDKIKEYKKKWYETNKEQMKEKIECEYCKSIVNNNNLKKHQKTLKCLKFQSLVNED